MTTGGCKSTSGGCLMIGSHFLRAWSKMQQAVTTSSAEAELVAMNRAASELLGCMAMFTDFGESDGRARTAALSPGRRAVFATACFCLVATATMF